MRAVLYVLIVFFVFPFSIHGQSHVDEVPIFDSQRYLIPSFANLAFTHRLMPYHFSPFNDTAHYENSNILKPVEDVLMKMMVGDTVASDGLLLIDIITGDSLFWWPPAIGNIMIIKTETNTWDIRGMTSLYWKKKDYRFMGLRKTLKKEGTHYKISEPLSLSFSLDGISCEDMEKHYATLKQEYQAYTDMDIYSTEGEQFHWKIVDLSTMLLHCMANYEDQRAYVRLFRRMEIDFADFMGLPIVYTQEIVRSNKFTF